MIETSYRFTVDDQIAFQMYLANNNRVLRWRKMFAWMFIPSLCGFFAVLTWGDAIIALRAFLASVAILWLIVFPIYWGWAFPRNIRKFLISGGVRGLDGEARIVLNEKTIWTERDEMKVEIPWARLEKIIETPTHTFVFIFPMVAHIWPRHGFQTEDEYRRVVDYAKERFAHFHGST